DLVPVDLRVGDADEEDEGLVVDALVVIDVYVLDRPREARDERDPGILVVTYGVLDDVGVTRSCVTVDAVSRRCAGRVVVGDAVPADRRARRGPGRIGDQVHAHHVVANDVLADHAAGAIARQLHARAVIVLDL